MPGPIHVDFTIWRGTAPTIEFSVIDDAGVAVDITGWTAMFTMRTATKAPDPPALQKEATIFGAAVNGKFRVALTRALTLMLAGQKHDVSFERTNAGFEDLLAEGTATVRFDILNPAS